MIRQVWVGTHYSAKHFDSVMLLTQADECACHPQDISNQCWEDQRTAQNIPILLLEGVHHGHIPVLSHGLGKEKATWSRREGIGIRSEPQPGND